MPVPRTAGGIAGVVRDMLRAATDGVFIDPHFNPQRPRYVNAIAACLRACREQRIPAAQPLYVLTELGGASLGAGLDEGPEGATDDVALLDRGVYDERWRQYASDPPAFDLPEEAAEVTGASRA